MTQHPLSPRPSEPRGAAGAAPRISVSEKGRRSAAFGTSTGWAVRARPGHRAAGLREAGRDNALGPNRARAGTAPGPELAARVGRVGAPSWANRAPEAPHPVNSFTHPAWSRDGARDSPGTPPAVVVTPRSRIPPTVEPPPAVARTLLGFEGGGDEGHGAASPRSPGPLPITEPHPRGFLPTGALFPRRSRHRTARSPPTALGAERSELGARPGAAAPRPFPGQ